MSDTFIKAKELLDSWKVSLANMQSRADEALQKARAAQTIVEENNSYIGSLGKFADEQKQNRLDQSDFKKASLRMEISSAQADISSAQGTIDEIRGEYSQKSAEIVSAYMLNVKGFWVAESASSPVGSFGSSAEDVTATLQGSLTDANAQRLRGLANVAGKGPTEYKAYLDALSELDAGALAEFFGSNSDLARYPLSATDDTVWETATVKDWWDNLDADQQIALIHHASGITGNLNGVPYEARNQANHALIEELLADDEIAQSTKDTLNKVIESSKFTVDEEDPKFILFLDISNTLIDDGDAYNDVLAAVAVGDVDAAEYTTLVAPGMNNNVDGSIEEMVQTAEAVYKEQKVPGSGIRHATIAWIGYETPQLNRPIAKSVLQSDLAEAGGDKLARFYDGLNVTKSSNLAVPTYGAGQTDKYNDPFISLWAHSYGTTTSAYALSNSQTKVDNVIFLDSAGITSETLAIAKKGKWQVEFRDHRQNIFYTEVDPDESDVARLGSFLGRRTLPSDSAIPGATSFSSAGGFEASGLYLEDADMHNLFRANNKTTYEDYRFSILNDGNTDGILSPGTSSLYFASQLSFGNYNVTEQKLIAPSLPPSFQHPNGSYPYTAIQNGKLSAEQVEKYAKEQEINPANLVKVKGK